MQMPLFFLSSSFNLSVNSEKSTDLSESDVIFLHERYSQFLMHATLSVMEQIKAYYLNAHIFKLMHTQNVETRSLRGLRYTNVSLTQE